MLNNNQTPIFILINILTILFIGVVYFISKEIYRTTSKQLSNKGVLISGSILGSILGLIYIFISMQVNFQISQSYGFGILWLSPSILIGILFAIYFDRRLIFPLMFFQTISFFIIIDYSQYDLLNEFLFILLEIISYILIAFGTYFLIARNNLIKNNVLKTTLVFFMYSFIIIIKEILYFLALKGISENFSIILIEKISIEIGYLLLFQLFLSIIIYTIDRFYNNFNKLETFSTKDDSSYYKMSLAKNKLKKIINENKIKKGALVLFDIKTEENRKLDRILNKIKKETEFSYKESFFFKVDANFYGAFFELDNNFDFDIALKNNKSYKRDENDSLYIIENALNNIKDKEKIIIWASASLYGIHSYSINDLIEYCKFSLTPIVTKVNNNSLIVYDFKRVKKRLKERTKVMTLPIDIESINISFLKGISSESIYYPIITYKNMSGHTTNFLQILNSELNNNEKSILLRHSAYQVLRRFKYTDSSIVIFYSFDYISNEEFKVEEFIKKIERHLSAKKIIIGLDSSGILYSEIFNQNLIKLKSIGIRFALLNPSESTQKNHDILKPDFLLDIQNEINPFKITKKKVELETNALSLNVNLI